MGEQTGEKARPRVSFTRGSIQGVLTARKRHVCGNHIDPERHYIEPGERYVANALPPDHPDIGNSGWWHLRVCLDCCPVEHDERVAQPTPSPSSTAPDTSGEQQSEQLRDLLAGAEERRNRPAAVDDADEIQQRLDELASHAQEQP